MLGKYIYFDKLIKTSNLYFIEFILMLFHLFKYVHRVVDITGDTPLTSKVGGHR